MEWRTVTEVVEEFGLGSDPQDVQAVIRELKERRKLVHPDASERDSKAEFQRLMLALEFVEQRSKMLVPLADVTALVDRLADAVATRQSADAQAAQAVAVRSEQLHRRGRPRRITLAAVGAVLSFVFLFPGQFESHPYLERFIRDPQGAATWGILVASLAALWLLTARQESANQSTLEVLYSRRFHERVLEQLGSSPFSRAQLQDAMTSLIRPHRPQPESLVIASMLRPFGLTTALGLDTVEEAADLALRRYLEAGIVRRVAVPEGGSPFSEWYRVAS